MTLKKWIETISIIILSLILLSSLLLSLFDLTKEFVNSNRDSKISDIIISFSTYLILILLGIIILISRTFNHKKLLLLIPKSYLPIKSIDLPKPAYKLISNEYDRISIINTISQPKPLLRQGIERKEKRYGWGKPGTPFEGIHFRTSILGTVDLLRSLTNPLLPPAQSQSTSSPLSPLSHLSSSSSSNPIPEALTPLLNLYEEILQKAKFGLKEPREEDWNTVVKIVAVVVGILGNGNNDLGRGVGEGG